MRKIQTNRNEVKHIKKLKDRSETGSFKASKGSMKLAGKENESPDGSPAITSDGSFKTKADAALAAGGSFKGHDGSRMGAPSPLRKKQAGGPAFSG